MCIGFFNKPLDLDGPTLFHLVRRLGLDLDVAITCGRMVWGNAQYHNDASLSLSDGHFHGLCEGCSVDHGLVSRRYHQHRVLAAIHGSHCSQGQSRRCVATHGLQQGGLEADACFAQLLCCQKAVFFTRDDQRAIDLDVGICQTRQAVGRLLKQALVTSQTKKLFGKSGPGQRPKPSA